MNLELKHLAPYLPYGLKVENDGHIAIITMMYLPAGNHKPDLWVVSMEDTKDTELSCSVNFKYVKPILRPLSDLYNNFEGDMSYIEILENDNEIDYWADNDLVMLEFNKCLIWELNLMPFGIMQKLFEWHFDVFGLIDKGLAIDVNTL